MTGRAPTANSRPSRGKAPDETLVHTYTCVWEGSLLDGTEHTKEVSVLSETAKQAITHSVECYAAFKKTGGRSWILLQDSWTLQVDVAKDKEGRGHYSRLRRQDYE